MTWTGSEYIAAGSEQFLNPQTGSTSYGFDLLVSPDGVNWSRRSTKWDGVTATTGDASQGIWSIASSGNAFVAIRGGIIYSSPDSINWTSHGLAGSERVVWNQNQFVIASYDGNNIGVLTSPDGVNWTSKLNLPYTDGTYSLNIYDAVWSGTAYIGVGMQSNMGAPLWGFLVHSNDANLWYGATWQSGFFTNLNRVLWDGEQFVASGSRVNSFAVNATVDAILTSPDGQNWNETYIGNAFHNFKGIAVSPMGYAAVGNDGAILTSP